MVQTTVIDKIHYALILETDTLSGNQPIPENMKVLVIHQIPTAENILKWIIGRLSAAMPDKIRLEYCKLWETRECWVEWEACPAVFSR